jgi:hypothetical protein
MGKVFNSWSLETVGNQDTLSRIQPPGTSGAFDLAVSGILASVVTPPTSCVADIRLLVCVSTLTMGWL